MEGRDTSVQVAIIGAGPYGLAAAAHLRAARVETHMFGEPMEFWERNMPGGMLLRSSPSCSHIAAPKRELSMEAFLEERGMECPWRLPRSTFVEYGRWIQERVAPDVDRRRVERAERDPRGFRLHTEDGGALVARRVVVATGIGPFAKRPPAFDDVPPSLASHASEPHHVGDPVGRTVVVVGGGQSALEAAGLLREAGADVEVVVRSKAIRWLVSRDRSTPHHALSGLSRGTRQVLRRVARPQLDIMGPRLVTWLVAWPRVYRAAPCALQLMLTARAMRPAVADWIVPRLAGVRLTTGRSVQSVSHGDSHVRLKLDDGSTRTADHVVLATGYRIDVRGYPFLADAIRGGLAVRDGYPMLEDGFESSIPGLHFLGAPAADTFGPICRFVVGTNYSARALTRRVFAPTTLRRRPSAGPVRVAVPVG